MKRRIVSLLFNLAVCIAAFGVVIFGLVQMIQYKEIPLFWILTAMGGWILAGYTTLELAGARRRLFERARRIENQGHYTSN